MTASVRRPAVLVLTWIMVTTSATAMAWWSVTFVTAEVADRRPLPPSEVVAASVRQAVPARTYAVERIGPIHRPLEQIVSPVTAVVVEAAATLPIHGATPPAPSAAVQATVAVASQRAATAVARTAVTVQLASPPPVSVKPSVPLPPVSAARTTTIADLPVTASVIAGLAKTFGTVVVMPGRRYWRAPAELHSAPATVDPRNYRAAVGAGAPKRQVRRSTHRHRPA